MSFAIDRNLICSGCKNKKRLSDVEFPEELHDTLNRMNIPHLHWICESCENNFKLFSSKSKLRKQGSKGVETDIKTVEIILHDTEDETYSSSSFSSSVDDSSNSKELEEREDFKNMGALSGLSEDYSNKNKSANTIINEILKTKVVINREQLRQSKEIFKTFISDHIIPFFKRDEVFAEVYQNIYYTGSSYNDLKISKADEYDVNLILNLSKQIRIIPEFFKETSMFAKIICEKTTEKTSGNVLKFLEKCTDSTINALDPLKIVSWLQSLIDKFIKSNPEISDVEMVKTFQSGPARTIQLKTKYGYSICIDLVPVFQFDYSTFKENSVLKKHPVDESKQFWFLVPKPCRGEQVMYAHETKLSWRVHLPETEKAVLSDKQCAKPVIKLLKLLRDQQNWSGYLSSYHCKTVVLWALKEHPDSKYWNQKFLYERFLEALKHLIGYFKENRLPYFFDENYNLFHQMNKKQASNMHSRLHRIVKSIEKDPENLKTYFLNATESCNSNTLSESQNCDSF